jgi:hypothetical protein
LVEIFLLFSQTSCGKVNRNLARTGKNVNGLVVLVVDDGGVIVLVVDNGNGVIIGGVWTVSLAFN